MRSDKHMHMILHQSQLNNLKIVALGNFVNQIRKVFRPLNLQHHSMLLRAQQEMIIQLMAGMVTWPQDHRRIPLVGIMRPLDSAANDY